MVQTAALAEPRLSWPYVPSRLHQLTLQGAHVKSPVSPDDLTNVAPVQLAGPDSGDPSDEAACDRAGGSTPSLHTSDDNADSPLPLSSPSPSGGGDIPGTQPTP